MSPRRGLRLTGRETQETRRQPAGSRAQEVFCPERTRLFSVSTSSRRPGKRSRLDTKSDSAEIMFGSVTSFCPCSSGSHHRKQELVKELQRNGVNFDVRKLNVGDFLWVAREKVAPVPGNGRQKLEETQQKTQTRLTVNTFSELRSRYNLIVSVSRSAASPRSPGARPRLRHREEEDGRPLRQHHRRTLQGTEGGAFLLELYTMTYRYLSDKIAKSFSSVCLPHLKKLTSISAVLILNKTFITLFLFRVSSHVSSHCLYPTLTFVLSFLPSVPTEEVWSPQARLPGGGVWDGRLPPEFT